MNDLAPRAETFRYRAFISYSHRDATWADWLHKAVERYRVPRALVGRATAQGVVPARLTPLFRDREELPAATDLSTVITAALESASHLVVLCSPRAAQSRWVNEEILAFKRLGRADRIVAIIVDGEPNSGDPATECFPPALKVTLEGAPAEPVAADARDTGDGKDNAKLKLIAGLLGVGLNDLKRRELQAQRRRTIFAYALTGVFALLAVAAAFFAFRAEQQRAVAAANLESALENATTLTFDIARKSRDAEGMRKTVLIDILKPTIRLLDGLAAQQALPAAVRLTQATALNELARASMLVGLSQAGIEACRRAIEVSAPTEAGDSTAAALANERALTLTLLGDAFLLRGRFDEAEKAYIEAEKLATALAETHGDAPDFARNLFLASNSLGEVKLARGQFVGALVAAFEAHRPSGPASLEAASVSHALRARVLVAMGEPVEAEAAFRKAIEIAGAWAGAAPGQVYPRLQRAWTRIELGGVVLALGRTAESLALTREAESEIDALWRADPDDISVRHALFTALFGQATAHINAGRTGEAEPLVARVQEVVAGRSDADAEGPLGLTDAAQAVELLAALHVARGEFPAARDRMRESVATMRRAFDLDTENITARQELARVLVYFGAVQLRAGDAAAALVAFDEALGHYAALAALKPFETQIKVYLGHIHVQIAQAKTVLGDREGARAAYGAARSIFVELAAADPDNTTYPSMIANIDGLVASVP
jgi:tetratricopeptide (TPR) repeat protein